MNLLLLLAALLPWAASPVAAFTRIFLAVSLLSVEMQLVTLSGVGSLHTLPIVNVVLAALLIGWQRATGVPLAKPRWLSPPAPWPALALLGALVILLNAWMPLEAADPYHLERLAQIERTGTLEYDVTAESKTNILSSVYELILADGRQVPVVGGAMVKMHGVFEFLLYVLTLAAVFTFFGRPSAQWPVVALLVVPPIFHQLVLVKNDLFITCPALVVLAWLVARAGNATWKEAAWAGWLVAFAVGYKLTNLPLAVVVVAGVIASTRGRDWRPLGGLALGAAAGILASGLLLRSYENLRVYGDVLASGPVAELGNQNAGFAQAGESIARFGISLFDFGLFTRTWWPGRGAWGGTFGLSFIWSLAVLAVYLRRAREARWALLIAATYFLFFSAVFPDADVAHRLVLAPALLMIAVAIHVTTGDERDSRWARLALVPVLTLASVQILRSAVLYIARG